MQSHKSISPGYSRRLKLELAAKELAGSGADPEQIRDILDAIGARRPEVAGALSALAEQRSMAAVGDGGQL